MRAKPLLLGSVSVVAVNAAATASNAQDFLAPEGYYFSAEGGFLMGPNSFARSVTEDKLGPASAGLVDVSDNYGYRAAISVGKRIDPTWDLRVGGAINQQLETTSPFAFSGGMTSGFSGNIRNDFDFETLDFEVGYTPTLDENFQVRLFAGIRGLHFTDTQSVSASDKIGFGFDLDFNSEFVGAGPRVGAQASTRFEGSNFGISGMVSGAVIYGRQNSSIEETVTSGGTLVFQISESDEEWKTVLDVAGSLGLDYYVADETKLTLGYRAEHLFNVSSPFLQSGGDSDDANRLVHGPFLKFESSF